MIRTDRPGSNIAIEEVVDRPQSDSQSSTEAFEELEELYRYVLQVSDSIQAQLNGNAYISSLNAAEAINRLEDIKKVWEGILN